MNNILFIFSLFLNHVSFIPWHAPNFSVRFFRVPIYHIKTELVDFWKWIMEREIGNHLLLSRLQSAESCRKASESTTRSVMAEADTSSRRTSTKVKREPATTTSNATTTTAPPTHPQGLSPSEDLRDEPGDFIETNCHWRDCGLEFPTQVRIWNFYIVL